MLSPLPESSRKILVLDNPDLLLAISQPYPDPNTTTSTALCSALFRLKEHVHATVITTQADSPLLHNASADSDEKYSTASPLEVNHAAFATGLAHQANLVLSVRGLDTGVARDVSGALRITGRVTREMEGRGGAEGKELLYFIQGNGGVKVFERGSGL